MDNKLAEKLFFSKEAADYLGITTQRLNMLVKEKKITPLKKNSSGTIFHIDELNQRKEEQKIFEDIIHDNEKGMFAFDTANKREAVNFATLINILGITEQHLEPLFVEFGKNVDVTIFLDENNEILDQYSEFFKIINNS